MLEPGWPGPLDKLKALGAELAAAGSVLAVLGRIPFTFLPLCGNGLQATFLFFELQPEKIFLGGWITRRILEFDHKLASYLTRYDNPKMTVLAAKPSI